MECVSHLKSLPKSLKRGVGIPEGEEALVCSVIFGVCGDAASVQVAQRGVRMD